MSAIESHLPSPRFSWHTTPILCQMQEHHTHLLTGGFLFTTSAIILLGGGSLFQPENRETSELQQQLQRKCSAPSQGPSTFPEVWSSSDIGMQLVDRGYCAADSHGHHRAEIHPKLCGQQLRLPQTSHPEDLPLLLPAKTPVTQRACISDPTMMEPVSWIRPMMARVGFSSWGGKTQL